MNKYFLILGVIICTFAFDRSNAKAEWSLIASGNLGRIYLKDESLYVEGNLRSAEVRHTSFGQGLFLVNCETEDYLIKTNDGEEKGYLEPGTVPETIADEICQEQE